MNDIKTVGVVGLGALGTLFARLLTRGFGRENVLVLADRDRIRRYEAEGVYFNGARCDFNYTAAEDCTQKPDLLLFAVKFGALDAAIRLCRHLVTPETTLVSVLNGVSSEQILGDAFTPQQVVWCVAQKMSAVKEGNHAAADPLGELAVGVPAELDRRHLDRLTAFFDKIGFPYSLPEDIRTHMWSKLLCNVGCNQSTMVFQCGYGGLQQPGSKARETMLGAMKEVILVANAQGIPLSEADIRHWVGIIDSFPPDGEPSMRQDGKAHRKSELELFAGTIRRLARKHGISVPVNDRIYQQVREMESAY